MGIYFRKYAFGIDVQAGYPEMPAASVRSSFIKQFDFVESGWF